MNATNDESAEIARQNLASTLFWHFHTGINCIVLRDHGAVVAAEVWRRVMLGQQHDHYHEGMRKLGIDQDEPPAVKAAKYHYLSNTVGGLRLHYIEETPRKVWIRYLAPLGAFPGMAMLAMPISLRRTILSTWHPRNGELMGCPRLGWVLTKLVCFGEPYDEGYFIECDHDLKPEDRVRFEHVQRTPEFDPAKAPCLDQAQWPPVRVAKASRNYAAGYLREVVGALRIVLGPLSADAVCRTAAACVAVQFTPSLVAQSGTAGDDAPAIARFFCALLHAGGDRFELEDVSPTLSRIRLHSFQPFAGPETAALRDAFFQFQIVAARMLNGRVAVSRADASPAGGGQIWTIEDKGHWLW